MESWEVNWYPNIDISLIATLTWLTCSHLSESFAIATMSWLTCIHLFESFTIATMTWLTCSHLSESFTIDRNH
jgi:hypothetical protein